MTLKVYFIGVSHAQTELKTTWQNSLKDYDHFRESNRQFSDLPRWQNSSL